jgi:hypothetical protein
MKSSNFIGHAFKLLEAHDLLNLALHAIATPQVELIGRGLVGVSLAHH